MKLYYPITVDLYQPYPLPIMEAQQNNIGRGALVTLTAQGAVITPTGESLQLYAKKPDGTISYLSCTLSGSQIECDFTNQMLALPGIVQVELQMSGGTSGNETEITTPIFCVKVNPSNVDQDAIESSNEFTALEEALAKVIDLQPYDKTFVLSSSGWSGDAAPYKQAVAVDGMEADAGVVFAQVTNGSVPTVEEQEAYDLIIGVAQSDGEVTFYASAIPRTSITIRAFSGSVGGSDGQGTSDYNDLSNKPKINGVLLEGDKTPDDIGVVATKQGIDNAGKVLGIGSDGNVTPVDGSGEGTPGKDGEDGGYYTPEVTQPTDTTMQMSFRASKADMPEVKTAVISLPSTGIENGLPIGGTAGQFLKKNSGNNYDVSWADVQETPRQQMQNTDTTVTLQPNVLYVFPEMASLTVTLGTPSDTNVANEYHFFFTSGDTATTLTLNDVLSDAYSIEAHMKYEVSILEGVAYIKGVAAT